MCCVDIKVHVNVKSFLNLSLCKGYDSEVYLHIPLKLFVSWQMIFFRAWKGFKKKCHVLIRHEAFFTSSGNESVLSFKSRALIK